MRRAPDFRGSFLQIHGGVHVVYVFLIQLFTKLLHTFTEALEVDDLPFPQEFDHVVYIGIVRQPQDVVIGGSCLLFWYDLGLITFLCPFSGAVF